jgi:hypothetical protein
MRSRLAELEGWREHFTEVGLPYLEEIGTIPSRRLDCIGWGGDRRQTGSGATTAVPVPSVKAEATPLQSPSKMRSGCQRQAADAASKARHASEPQGRRQD